MIHDAARPDFNISLLKKLINKLKKNVAVIPVIKSKDSIKYKIRNQIYNLDRNKAVFTQTPQAFRYKHLYELAKKKKSKVFKTYFGIGFDIHRLIINKKLYLGGVKIPFHSGLKGHSDGDVILHAIIDAILGAMKKKDIGTYFPSNKSKFKNIRSPKMLKPILNDLNNHEISINNLDINLICEKPNVSKNRNKIINSLSKLMTLDKNKINLKGKTVEKLGLIGKEKAIACEVIISITKYD